MKVILSLLASTLLIAGAQADDATLTTEKPAAEAAAAALAKKLQVDEERARAALAKKPVIKSGFLHDLSKAEDKKRFFSLRQPRDPKTDYKNISFDERTERPRGFVLFRLEF